MREWAGLLATTRKGSEWEKRKGREVAGGESGGVWFDRVDCGTVECV